MSAYLPKEPFKTLALSLSGGGYRAASFHLGLLTYLSSIKWKEKSLLERVRVLSTVSGGTFTGLCYATSLAQDETLADCYKKLYNFMKDVDLLKDGLTKLSGYKEWKSGKGRSLINAFSLVYFEKLEDNTFSLLFDKGSHLKEIIFNATEFSYGLPFRLQRCEQKEDEFGFAFLGNRQVNMPHEAITEIRLADVIAASSCFPLGFEPINFPDDFKHDNSPTLDSLKESYKSDRWGEKCEFPIGLMDGGIVDNQGIDSVIWAEERMSKYKDELKELVSDDVKAIDLYIISDVASPFMDSYIKTEEKPLKKWRKLSFKRFILYGLLLLSAGALSVLLALYSNPGWLIFVAGFLTALFLILSGVSFFISRLFKWLLKVFKVPDFFLNRLKKFSNMKFGVFETLIVNRISSATSLVSEVFMKQIRRQEYNRVYDEKEWESRLIMNAIYELTSQNTDYRNKKSKDILSKQLKEIDPSIMDIAEKAKEMDTTLWFTPEELEGGKENLLNTLIVCGQFTACFNLLEYIEKVLWNEKNKKEYNKYPKSLKSEIKDLYDKMSADWNEFKEDPYWMIKKYQVK